MRTFGQGFSGHTQEAATAMEFPAGRFLSCLILMIYIVKVKPQMSMTMVATCIICCFSDLTEYQGRSAEFVEQELENLKAGFFRID